MDSFETWITGYRYYGIFALLMLGIVGLPVPDETLLTFTGYLLFKGELAFAPALLAAFLGTTCGITVSYGLGRTLGFRAIRRFGHLVHVKPERLGKVRAWYARRGKWALVVGYYVPGIRHLTAFVAGSAKLPLPVFGLFAYAGGLVWASTFIILGYLFGEEWARWSSAMHRLLVMLAVLIALGLVVGLVWGRVRRVS